MTCRIPAALLVLAVTTSGALAAPSQLYGKTVVISTSETRTSRPVGGGATKDATASNTLSVYISSNGRAFVRSDRTLNNRRGSQSKAMDTGPEGGAIGVSVARDRKSVV